MFIIVRDKNHTVHLMEIKKMNVYVTFKNRQLTSLRRVKSTLEVGNCQLSTQIVNQLEFWENMYYFEELNINKNY